MNAFFGEILAEFFSIFSICKNCPLFYTLRNTVMILVQGRLFQTAESWASFGELRKEVYMCTWYSGLRSEWMDLKAKVLNYRRAKTLYFSVVSAKHWAKNNKIWKDQQWSEG